MAAQDHLPARGIPTKKQIQDISVMLDFDMLASPNYAPLIYDGNGDEHGFAGPNGSGTVEQVFKDFWNSQGLAHETIPFDGRSDYDAFTTAGIPAGGIFAGAEVVNHIHETQGVQGPSSASLVDPTAVPRLNSGRGYYLRAIPRLSSCRSSVRAASIRARCVNA